MRSIGPDAQYGGAILMKILRQILRNCLVLIIIALTFFSGRSAGGCVCPDGHFKLFCGGKSCCPHPKNSVDESDCCCSKHTEADQHCCSDPHLTSFAPHPNPLPRVPGRGGEYGKRIDNASPDCCQPVQLSPMVGAKALSFEFADQFAAQEPSISQPCFPIACEQLVRNYELDVRPPRARLSLLQHFLI